MASGTPRGQWTGQLGFVLAAAGAAIGLGNIWKFPYMAGSNGGSAFVIIYLVCVVLIGLPIMAAEILTGKSARANPVDAIAYNARRAGHTGKWAIFGWWGFAALLLVLSFYTMVAGWSIYYFFITLAGSFESASTRQVLTDWHQFMDSPLLMLAFNAVFILMTMGVVARGVQHGLEKGSRIMMPLLFILLVFLVGYGCVQGEALHTLHFLFDFNIAHINTGVVINAMGHAFFTLAIGAGAMAAYGSYLPRRISIGKSIVWAAGLDVLVALLAGFAIYAIIFRYDLAVNSGPGLMFISLPMAFATMPAGQYIGALFFLLLIFAAWTSSINIAEPVVATILEKTRLSRQRVCVLIGIAAWLLSILSVLSFNVWADIKLFGHWTPFELISDTATNLFLPIGGIFYAIFCGWIMTASVARDNLNFRSTRLFQAWRFLVRFIAPAGVLCVLIASMI